MMEVFMQWVSHEEFNKRTGIIHDNRLLIQLIIPDWLVGEFLPERCKELIRFCKKHPEYHIISSRNLRRYNRCMGNANGYYLGTGDPDPDLAVDFRPYLANYKVSGGEILEASGADLSPKGRNIKLRFYS